MRANWFWWGVLSLTVAGISAAFVWKSLAPDKNGPDLPILGQVQDFTLKTRQTNPFARADLLERHGWRFYLHVNAPECPLMIRKNASIQALLRQ